MEKEVTFTMREMERYGVIQALLVKKMTAREAASAGGLIGFAGSKSCPISWPSTSLLRSNLPSP